jgi:hypothetical protein
VARVDELRVDGNGSQTTMITLITYTDSQMTISATRCVNTALKNGANEVKIYTPDMVSEDFKKKNSDIWKEANRGAGCYWLFKPYVIYDAMLSMNDGDILVYSDAGIEFIDSLHHITNRMDDYFFMTNGFNHIHWCKADILDAILNVRDTGDLGWDVYKLNERTQIQASLLFFKINESTKEFVKEWLLFCQMPGLINDSQSWWKNHKEFQENRHDQAILTTLAIKYSIDYNNLWCDKIWENQRYRWPHSTYPPILLHTRKRNHEWK